MTTADLSRSLDALLAADLSDRATRFILADALEDVGRVYEAGWTRASLRDSFSNDFRMSTGYMILPGSIPPHEVPDDPDVRMDLLLLILDDASVIQNSERAMATLDEADAIMTEMIGPTGMIMRGVYLVETRVPSGLPRRPGL